MGTKVKNIVDSWVQILISIFIFAIFIGVGYLLVPYIDSETSTIWSEEFIKYIILAGISGFFLQLIIALVFPFVDNGNKKSAWNFGLIVNIIAPIAFIGVLLLNNPDYNQANLALFLTIIMFLFMYLFSYIISTLFMPKSYRFSNPLAGYLFNS